MSDEKERSLVVDHPYYASQGNYFNNDCHAEYGSWQEFVEVGGDADLDMNLVYRWDWRRAEPEWDMPHDRLLLYFVGQRKALHRSAEIRVSTDDEDAIREWLRPRWDKLRDIWAPISELEPATQHRAND